MFEITGTEEVIDILRDTIRDSFSYLLFSPEMFFCSQHYSCFHVQEPQAKRPLLWPLFTENQPFEEAAFSVSGKLRAPVSRYEPFTISLRSAART